jgi:hypothetical protein
VSQLPEGKRKAFADMRAVLPHHQQTVLALAIDWLKEDVSTKKRISCR